VDFVDRDVNRQACGQRWKEAEMWTEMERGKLVDRDGKGRLVDRDGKRQTS
jgi:hypothetical protein